MRFRQLNGIWTYAYDSIDLGITPGVTVVGAAAFEFDLPWRGARHFGGVFNYTLGGGVTLKLSFIPLAYDGVTALGNGLAINMAGGSQVCFQHGKGYTNNGQWDIFGVGNGNFAAAGNFPPAACETLRMRIERTAGANNSTLGITNLFLRS